MNSIRGTLRTRYAAVILSAVIGIIVTIGAFLMACRWEYRVAEVTFQSEARRYLDAINADLGDASTLLYTISAFIGSDDHRVSAGEFARFSAALHRRVTGLRDTAWAPRVTLSGRRKFERDARTAGITRYQIKQIGPHHKLIPAAPRAEYYALLYIEAGGAKRPMLGVDLIAERTRAAAALRALRTGQPAATPPMDVLTVKQPGAGVLSYMPVYGSSIAGGTNRHSVKGLVLGVFDIPVLVESILAKKVALHGLNLYLFNPGARPDRRMIYRTGSVAPGPQLSERELRAGTYSESTVLLIDQHLGAIITPAEPLRGVHFSLFGFLTLIAGFTITGLTVAYLLVSLRRTLQLEALTASLQATTVVLHEKAEEITQMSRHDALTGLPNRLMFRERMNEAIARFRRGAAFALLFLDLDRFKEVNDTLGHGTGDSLLCAVAERIKKCIRETDTAVRLGGDEFAIILEGSTDCTSMSVIANRLIESIGKPYTINGQQVVIGVSIGGSTAAPGTTSEDISGEADLAMYDAKEAGRGTFRVFQQRLRTRAEEKRLVENDLRHGLEAGELEVYYQPVLNLAENRASSFEALVRWNHPARGLILPGSFIPVAEECGLIGQLGSWVLRTACEDAARWPTPVKVCVNISPIQFKDTELLGEIVEILTSSALPPGRLELELTEAAVLQHCETTLAMLAGLRELGVTVAFDDFGTGYSSLSSLLRFPFDKIKIDRSFVQRIETSASAAAIVRAVVGLGTSLNLTTTGEGVETLAQLQRLRGLGCSEAQGYLFSPAQPNAEVPRLLREFDGRSTMNAVPAMTYEMSYRP